jgi:gliding motility-associated-like protein
MNKPILFLIFSLATVLSLRLPGHFLLKNIEVKNEMTTSVTQLPVVVTATPTGSQPNVNVGYCQTGQSTVTFTNQGQAGNPAQSLIKNLSLGIGLSNAFLLQDNAFTITGIRIAGVNISNFQAMNSLTFTTDPDGPGGLSDADGDGVFDDLALGQSVEITAFYTFNCSLANNFNLNGNCLNSFTTVFNARMNYEEADGSQQTFTLPDYLRPANENTGSEHFSDPDAFLGVDTFFVTLRQTRSVRFFQNNCTGGQLIVRVPLANGLSAVTDSIRFIKNGNVAIPLLTSNVQNDTLILAYNTSFSSFLSGDYELRLALTANCFYPLGASVFPVSVEHFCPDCNCRHRWFCGEIPGPEMHATTPPCPSEIVPDCTDGLQTLSFEANRTTFGFSDANFTTPFNPNLANKKVALGCDSVQMKMTGVVGMASVPDSIGMAVTYGNPNGTAASGEIFLFNNGNLRIRHDGSIFNCPVSPSSVSVTSAAGKKTMRFDLNSCLTGLGFALSPGDSLSFTGNFYVNPDGPFLNSFEKVPDFRGWFFNKINGTDVVCDHFGETFTLGKARAVYAFPTTAAGMPNGCNNGEINWRLFVPDNEFSNFFGNELRPAARVDSIVFDFDPGILTGFENIQVTVSLPGHPVFGNGYFPVQSLTAFPNGHYVARFDTMAHTPSLNVVKEYIFDLKLKMTPRCASAQSSAAGNGNYAINSKISYKGRFYANSIGNGSCVEQKTETALTTLAYKNPPAFNLTNITPASDTVVNDMASWDVQLCNTSALSGAGLAWLAVEDPTGTVGITSIQNITNPGNPVTLALTPYGQHVFAYTPAIGANQCLKLRINSTVNNCGDAIFKLRSGWNCGPFTQPNWNPTLYPPCQEKNLTLGVVNLGVSPVQVNFTNVSSVCEAGSTEAVTISGTLTSGTALPSDVFVLKFVDDVNGDGTVQTGEPVLGQVQVSGIVSPVNPLVFTQNLQISPAQACRILVQLTANSTDLCGAVALPLPLPQLQNAGTDQIFCTVPGTMISTSIGGGACSGVDYQFSWTALAPATLAMLDDPTKPNPMLSFDPANFLGQTLAFVLETKRTGCSGSSFDTVRLTLPASNDGFFAGDQVTLQTADCQGTAELCLNVTAAGLPDLIFTDNGAPYSGPVTPCGALFFALNLTTGSHEIIITDTAAGCADTVQALVTCTTTDTVSLDILLNQSLTICLNSGELTGPMVSLNNFCLDGSQVSYLVQNDSCLTITGESVGQETACLVACDAAGFCDTTIVNINVLHPLPQGIKDTITVSQQDVYCFNPQQVNVPGPLTVIENICPQQSGQSVAFSIDTAGLCMNYEGLSVGTNTACIRLCDDLGNCDTINISVTVVPGSIVTDTVFIFIETDTFCLDETLLPGAIVSVTDICPDDNGDDVIFNISGNCVSYHGVNVGVDTACIRMEDEFGNVALVKLIVSVVKTYPETFCDTIFIGETGSYCLSTSELPGLYDPFSFREVCPGAGTGNADFFLEPVSRCVFYTGESVGIDSACVVVCDTFGYCDTTFFCMLVLDYPELPGLGDDTVTTIKNTPVVINFLANDTLFGGIVDIFILDQPISGEAILNLDNSFTYIPDDPFCARWDNFTYVACNPNGCDTAMVSIFIECIELTVFTAVSPNNDGVNDVFYIAKIEDFPENRLWVYNRWGSLVFETREYENTWPGSWGDDTDLPDGTYYYILEWTDGGVTTVQRGYFEMFR